MEAITELCALVSTDFNRLEGRPLTVRSEHGVTFDVRQLVTGTTAVKRHGADKEKQFKALKKARDWMRAQRA